MGTKNIAIMLRRFGRQKLTTFLHIIGLTLGIGVCLLIGLFIRHELSFDMYHAKADRIYRVNQVWIDHGKKEFHFSTPFPLANAIRSDVTGIENVTKVHHPFSTIVEINPLRRFKQDHVMMTDPEFLDVFDVKVISGNAHEALRQPYHALLTESTARKFYGSENPIGKIFKYNNKYDITVGGVVADFPGNTHLAAKMLLSFSEDEGYLQTSTTHYGSVSGGSTFIVLPEGHKPDSRLMAGLIGIYDKNVNSASWMGKDSRVEMEVQPLSDIHFNSKYAGGGEWVKAVNTSWLWFFGSVGIAVLVLACINFVNLSTAQAITRAKEVGVRKTVGAGKGQLIMQFLQEAFLLVFFSTILGVVLAKIFLPSLNALADKDIQFDLLHSYSLFGYLLIGIILTTLFAGLYPAWIITRFQPVNTLKSGSVNSNPQSAFLRKGLVVAQFSISVCLLIAVLLIGKQMNYMRSKNLGFDKENIVMVKFPEGDQTQKNLFRSELQRIPQVKSISFSTSPPSGDEYTHWGTLMSNVGRDDANKKRVTTIMSDDRYWSVYGLQLLAGRFPVAGDTSYVSQSLPEGQRIPKTLVNETLVKEMGFGTPAAAIGKRFWTGLMGWTVEVVGVVKDFNTGSLHQAITPTLITQYEPFTDKANIRLSSGTGTATAITQLESVYKKMYPKEIFEFNFLDEQLDALYKTEKRLYSLFEIFAGLAILISCLGLWGLVTFAARRRVKEIGVRKVLGASVMNIVALLTKDFILLVGIAIVIATPLTYWGISRWLQDFAFRTPIGWAVFAVAAASAVLIAILTVSFQAIRAGLSSPVESLRRE